MGIALLGGSKGTIVIQFREYIQIVESMGFLECRCRQCLGRHFAALQCVKCLRYQVWSIHRARRRCLNILRCHLIRRVA